jgi:kumamolisin
MASARQESTAPVASLPIKGSTRHPLRAARVIGPTDPSRRIKISLYARQNPATVIERARVLETLSTQFPRQRQYLDNQQFETLFGADPADLERLRTWAGAKGLRVLDANTASRRVLVEGTVAQINAAFTTTLNDYQHPRLGHFRGREGALQVDSAISNILEGVFGLDNRKVGRPRLRRLPITPSEWESLDSIAPAPKKTKAKRAPKAGPTPPWRGTFFPPQVAALYSYPTQFTGKQQNVAVFAFNGGTDGDPHGGYNKAALQTYFTQTLGGKMASIQDVVVQGPGNFPGPDTTASANQGDATGEVMLDLCVVGSLLPDAKIFVYFTEFTTQGWIDALHAAVTDGNAISVISISYGNPEDDPEGLWTAMGVKAVDKALEAAAAKGITICVASGDDGSADDEQAGAHVDFPASSPHVLAVGGTKLVAKANAISAETVWNEIRFDEGAGGGGVSVIFSRPDYQSKANVPRAADPPHRVGRGVPDVAAVADPKTGVVVMHVDGVHLEPIGGTSASAPLWASLIALINQGIQTRCGFINPLLYTQLNKGVLRDITVGSNGAYASQAGWDACTGFGAPGGAALLKALSKPAAGGKHK